MRRAHGETVAEITRLLTDYGPMSRSEICDHLGLDRMTVSSIVSRMNRATPLRPRRLYIQAYTHDHEGERRYPRAIYALGDQPDAKRPKADPRGAKRRYNARIKALHTTNFVFNLALPRRVYENRRSA